MSEDDIETIGADGPANAARIDRDRRAPRFSWTPAYETTFFRSLCESVQLGLRENSSFKAEAWERAAQALQATHGAYPAKSHLINKSDNARKRFRLWRGLREDPEFAYDPVMRTVSATEEAWKSHIEKEPLSRALRGRPFEHEDYMEVLYPDVIGSGGAPKRIMKPRRRTDGADEEMPGTGVLNLQVDMKTPTDATPPSNPQLQRPTLSQTPTGSSNGSIAQQPTPHHTQPPTGLAPMPTITTSTAPSALTPPDETLVASQVQAGRKRKQADSHGSPPLVGPPPPFGGPAAAGSSSGGTVIQEKRRRTSAIDVADVSSSAAGPAHPLQGVSSSHLGASGASIPLVEELLEALRARASPRWREQALDIFFDEFRDEDLDLQVKISENVLSLENKAMVFCKMPKHIRQHWVGKYRDMHQQSSKAITQ